MPLPAEYRPWVEFALVIAGARKTGNVNRTCWLYPLLKELADEAAEGARWTRRRSLMS